MTSMGRRDIRGYRSLEKGEVHFLGNVVERGNAIEK